MIITAPSPEAEQNPAYFSSDSFSRPLNKDSSQLGRPPLPSAADEYDKRSRPIYYYRYSSIKHGQQKKTPLFCLKNNGV
jgi:hypothetical protein